MIRYLISVAVMAFALPAIAQDLPRYDVKAHCDQVASFTGSPSEMIRQGCFQQEQAS